MSKSRIPSAISLLVLMLLFSFFFTSFATVHHTAWADTTVGNTTETSSASTSANFNLTTAAVVTFVLVLLGLAASMLLMARYANQGTPSE
ncbi:MAG: hypothetical protein ACLP5V_00460 [Candidatus Bathyarchaeia archaeon]